MGLGAGEEWDWGQGKNGIRARGRMGLGVGEEWD